MTINNTHKKYSWLQKIAPEKIVKINAKGRWNSSKDYQNIRQQIKNLAATNSVQQVNKTKDSIPSLTPKTESLLGIHAIDLKVNLVDMLKMSLNDIPKTFYCKACHFRYYWIKQMPKDASF